MTNNTTKPDSLQPAAESCCGEDTRSARARWVQFCLLGRPQLTVKPARSFGLQRVHVDLNLVNVTAFGASQRPVLEAVACLGNSMNLCARLTHGTAKTPLAPRR